MTPFLFMLSGGLFFCLLVIFWLWFSHRQNRDHTQAYLQFSRHIQDSIHAQITANTDHLVQQVAHLMQTTRDNLKDMSGLVEKRLHDGFQKTTATFTDVLTRLATIDEAQRKITELSGQVISLQSILTDKRARGAFGEVQLKTLVDNVLPPSKYHLQHTLSNGKRADCLLLMPPPTGHIVVDAKFPLENYQKMIATDRTTEQQKAFESLFRQDVLRHIQAIAEKYILPNETAESAILFIPAEAIFAEIHARFPELVEASHRAKVWLVSPSTLMAVLTTACAVLKDEATRQQIHLIQTHLSLLGKDFMRFKTRMENLARHIQQVNQDVSEITISAEKISHRFEKIERAELTETESD